MVNDIPYKGDFPFSIADVAGLLYFRVRRKSAVSMYVDCPFCNYDKGKMNISFERDTFRCNYCGKSGGMLKLYAEIQNISTSDAYREICEALRVGNGGTYQNKRLPEPKKPTIERPPRLDSETVHQTFSFLLSMLTLTKTHEENLLRRGLSKEDIVKQGYKSTPAFGYHKLTKMLIDKGCVVKGVPGFFMDSNMQWTVNFKSYLSGILVPVKSLEGKIQGLQIRLDNPKNPKRRYMWFSSVDEHLGVTSGGPVHFAGNPMDNVVYITEGPIKANVAHVISGRSFVAIPGANALSALYPVLESLRRNGVTEVVEAYDMDKFENEHVLNGSKKLFGMVTELGFKTRRMNWDSRYKGIDDYLLARKLKQEQS